MKQNTTKIRQPSFLTRSVIVAVAVLSVMVAPLGVQKLVFADNFDDQIGAAQSQIDSYNSEIARLRAQSNSLQNELAVLALEQQQLQSQVDLSQDKHDKLVADIAANEKHLVAQQDVLGETIGDLAMTGETTPLKILAGSDTVGDYVSRQEEHNAIQEQIQTSIKQIQAIKNQLAQQKIDIDHVLADQKAQQGQLAAKKAEQADLLAQTQGQESSFQSLVASKNSEISSLKEQQAAANAAAAAKYAVANVYSPGSCGGGYPDVWCNAGQDTLADSWGMLNRECVSYTAYRVAASGRYMPYWGGIGNANQWVGNAISSGIATGYTPKVGAVAIMNVGYYGHAMYVERVNGDGTIHVSQFNWGLRGEYSEMNISQSGLTYIYF